MKKLLLGLSIFGMLMTSGNVLAQNKKKETKAEKAEIKAKKKELRERRDALRIAAEEQENLMSIETLNFSFTPITVTPEFGIEHDITSMYPYVEVDKDDFTAQLPYMGNFYIDPIELSEMPINIYSAKFLYSVHTEDGIIYNVLIVPTDTVNILNQSIKFNFTLDKNTGYGTLVVTAENRDSITFTGMFNNN